MPRHKHEPIGVKTGRNYIIEECKVCKKRRITFVGAGSGNHSRFVSRDDDGILGWLWREVAKN